MSIFDRPIPPIGFDPRTSPDAKVDCGSCTACCRREAVVLVDEDDPADYPDAVFIMHNPLTGRPGYMIPHKRDGSCVYLGEQGCTIYEKRPKMCRVFSCVGFAKMVLERTTRAERRKDIAAGILDATIMREGKKRGAA